MELRTSECVGKCDWKPAVEGDAKVEREGQPIFECGGCGSEWAPSESWTPKNADGTIAPSVAAAVIQASQAGGEAVAEGQSENDSADNVAAPDAPQAVDAPPVIEAQAEGLSAPANDSADNAAADGGTGASSW